MHAGNFKGGYGREQSLGQNNANTFNPFQTPKNSSQVNRGGFTGVNGVQRSPENFKRTSMSDMFQI